MFNLEKEDVYFHKIYIYKCVCTLAKIFIFTIDIYIYVNIKKLYAYVDTVVPKSRKVISKGLKIKRPTKYTKPKTSKQNINYMNPDAVKPQIASSLVN